VRLTRTAASTMKYVSAGSVTAQCSIVHANGAVYSATLNMVDSTSNTNSFYVLQAIASATNKTFYLWRKWGRGMTPVHSAVSTPPPPGSRHDHWLKQARALLVA
jgi:hypothetical protein